MASPVICAIHCGEMPCYGDGDQPNNRPIASSIMIDTIGYLADKVLMVDAGEAIRQLKPVGPAGIRRIRQPGQDVVRVEEIGPRMLWLSR